MLRLRRQLPVHSPIRPASLLAGLVAALGIDRPRPRLRDRLADHFGACDVLLADSGTTALRLAIEGALRTRDSDVVALPAYCCFDVATAAIGAGARVALYDVDPATLGPDWGSLEEVLAGRSADPQGVAAVVGVHLYGLPIDVARLAALAEAHGTLLIEDAAQGFGGGIGTRPLGAIGSLGVLSFGRGKGITGGGGGALLANDDAGIEALAAARRDASPARGRAGWSELAKLAVQWLLGRPSVYGLPASIPWLGLGETRYHEPWPPREIQRSAAAAVLANWDASLAEADVRRESWAALAALAELPTRVTMPESPVRASIPGALRRPVVVDRGIGADLDAAGRPGGTGEPPASARDAGIQSGYPPLAELPALVSRRIDPEASYPQASRLTEALFTLPTHGLSDPAATLRAGRRLADGPAHSNTDRG